MSADNGVYILQTKGPEYRVCYGSAIDNLYEGFNDTTLKWIPNMKEVRDMFCESKVFNELEDAFDYAHEIAKDYEYLEDGVCLIADFKEEKFDR